MRIGLHTGEAIKDAGKIFGLTVILAARIAATAKGQQILVSSALKGLTGGSQEARYCVEAPAFGFTRAAVTIQAAIDQELARVGSPPASVNLLVHRPEPLPNYLEDLHML